MIKLGNKSRFKIQLLQKQDVFETKSVKIPGVEMIIFWKERLQTNFSFYQILFRHSQDSTTSDCYENF